MRPTSKYSTGIRYGLITGVVYAILLFLRYNFFTGSPLSFGLFIMVSYLIVLVLYLFAGIARKKELVGYADFKDIFRTIFITILITEAVYIIFNAIYLKYVDPSFFDNFKSVTRDYLEKHGANQDQIDQQLKKFEEAHKQMSPVELIKGFASWIVIDSIIGMIYAAILRKKKDIFQENKL
jgi:hypothetical protein